MTRRKPKIHTKICVPANERLLTYAAIVRAYLNEYRDKAHAECHHFQSCKSYTDAIESGATAKCADGRKHDHQWRIPPTVLHKFASNLLKVKNQLKTAVDFNSLWKLVQQEGNKIKGIGELAVYDTSQRIGAYLNLIPEYVYLHAGTRKGAQALGLKGSQAYLRMEELPIAFHKLTPAQCEDCLCIYKDQLAVIKREQNR